MLRFRATSIKKTSEMEFTGTPMTASLGTEVIRIRNAATAIGTSFIMLTMLGIPGIRSGFLEACVTERDKAAKGVLL